MKWASAVSTETRWEASVASCAARVREQLGEGPVDFAALFLSGTFASRAEDAGAAIAERLTPRVLLGTVGQGVIGDGREVEGRPAASLLAARLPEVRVTPFAVQAEDLPDGDASPRAWEALIGVKAAEEPHFVLLGEPSFQAVENLLQGLDFAFPKAATVGGLASGPGGPGRNALLLNTLCLRSGLIGAAFTGNLRLDAVVAQGCRPVGLPMRVTECRENALLGLDGRPPLEVLQQVFQGLPERDRRLLRDALFVGIARDSGQESPRPGDFLIRNVVGFDNEHGYLAVGAALRPGQTVQFHLRDAQSSTDDLRAVFARHGDARSRTRGALLFSCTGRGRGLYGRPDHDVRYFLQNVAPVPVGGFFCNGEIGPVGGVTSLHGYTSCFGLFGPRA